MRLLLVGLLAAACSDSRAPQQERPPQRRVIEPPSGTLTQGPPYPISADAVGPYKLRQPIAAVLDRLDSGPLRFEIPNLLHSGLSRAEDSALLIGSEMSAGSATPITFIAVVGGSEVASMEGGLHVGSSKEDAIKLAATDDLEHAHDPRLLTARNARLVIEKKKVAAIVLTNDPSRDSKEPKEIRDECPRPASTETAFGICMTGTGELVERDGDDLIVKFPDSEKLIARRTVPNLAFAVPLRNAADGRDELIAITRTPPSPTEDATQATWMIVGFRTENGQLKNAVDPKVLYQVAGTQTRWIGAELREIDLYLELASRTEGIEVGGLLTTTRGDRIHDVVTIVPMTVPRKHHKPATNEAVDAGVPGGDSSDRSIGSASR